MILPSTMIRRAAFSILLKENQVLLVQHLEGSSNPPGTYGLPGGRIEPGEEPKEAAAREMLEETGIIVHPESLAKVGTYSISIDTKHGMEPWNVDLYVCTRFDAEITRKEKGEDPCWLKIDDVLRGMYKMPRMSNDYLSVISRTLRDYANGSIRR